MPLSSETEAKVLARLDRETDRLINSKLRDAERQLSRALESTMRDWFNDLARQNGIASSPDRTTTPITPANSAAGPDISSTAIRLIARALPRIFGGSRRKETTIRETETSESSLFRQRFQTSRLQQESEWLAAANRGERNQ